MFTSISSILAALLLKGAHTFPYPFLNTTKPVDSGYCDGSNLPPGSGSFMCPTTNLTAANVSKPIIEYHCQDVYPTDLTVVNSRYPTYNQSHLHEAKLLFMLRRQLADQGEIGTRVQFTGLPSNTSNTTCRLEFILPRPDLELTQGFNPSFNVYQVQREAESIATWNTYVGNSGVDLFGRVNGEPEALERTRSVGGVAAINETRCNDTLTFQMDMAYNSKDGIPNYWEFSQVTPPAWPVQGFKIVYGC